MRVLCSTINGNEVEGEVIGSEHFDSNTGLYELEERFTLRCDDGRFLEVHGWLVDVTVLDPRPLYIM